MKTALSIFVLLAILAGAVFVGHYGWVSAGDVVMPAWGWLMMGLGIFFTLVVGGGLMALVFYSSRAGFDEAPEIEPNADLMTAPKTALPIRWKREANRATRRGLEKSKGKVRTRRWVPRPPVLPPGR
jgi:hypothetical protein